MLTSTPSDLAALPARERLLLTAHRLFYGEGIRATGIDRVIAESGVTKVTFYRHFPSKNDLVVAVLEHRHRVWMAWFVDALRRHGGETRGLKALVPALREWVGSDGYRGCAFLNGVAELGGTQPEVLELTRRHKRDMEQAIAGLLPPSRHRARDAMAVAMAVDGAIVRAQFEAETEPVLKTLDALVKAWAVPAGT